MIKDSLKIQEKLSFLGKDYETKLLHQIIGYNSKKGDKYDRNCIYGEKIISIIDAEHFDSDEASIIMQEIKLYYDQYFTIPYYDTLKGIIKGKFPQQISNMCLKYLTKCFNINTDDHVWVRDSAQSFIKMQNLLATSKKIEEIAKSGQYENYSQCVDLVLDAIQTNDVEENHYIVEQGNYEDMKDKKRQPHSIGWGEALDHYLNGGLSKSELMLIIAGSGVGKTTLATIAANHLFSQGHTVLQIFFEDTVTQIRQKQRSRWSGVDISQIAQGNNIRMVKTRSDKKILKAMDNGGTWILKKFKRVGTTTSDLVRYLKKLESLGIKPDYLIVDYLECFEPKRHYKEDWGGEKEIIIDLEDIASESEFNLGVITFTQGNRGSMNTIDGDTNHMGGNFKKFQIAHINIILTRTIQQQSENKANATILKSRVGPAGINFRNFHLDNGKMQVDINNDCIYTDDEYAEVKPT